VGLIGKFLDSAVKGPMYKGYRRPWDKKFVAEITDIQEKGGRRVVLDVNYYTGDETPWQGPKQDAIRTTIPEGVEPRIGQRIVVGSGSAGNSLSNNPRPVFWDEPAPELPPMQFPNIPGGNDPKVMLGHLESQVESGGLSQEGLERARAYLEHGGWPDPAETRS
jgi:hypothetical protein